jgi:DNA-binding HxlR family transcriptional regulator
LERIHRDAVRDYDRRTVQPGAAMTVKEMGLSLSEPASAFGQWAHEHLAKIDAARDQFNQRAIFEQAAE